jgi:hypothetical protein
MNNNYKPCEEIHGAFLKPNTKKENMIELLSSNLDSYT